MDVRYWALLVQGWSVMCLRYPNARLAVLERLVQRSDGCAAALLDCARDFELVDHSSSSQPACAESCHALHAARVVIESILAKKGIEPGSELMSGKVEQIVDKVQSCLVEARQEFEDKPHAVDDHIGCSRFAPLVMDCMLQHLQPYL